MSESECRYLQVTPVSSYCTYFLRRKKRPFWVEAVRPIRPHFCSECACRKEGKGKSEGS